VIILDTNVLSEIIRADPDTRVLTWLEVRPLRKLYTTTISLAEMGFGLAVMPTGAKRARLETLFKEIFEIDFIDRIHGFDVAAARAFVTIYSERQKRGRPMTYADAQIAAITRAHSATLATRNVRDFADCGIDLVNPWTQR